MRLQALTIAALAASLLAAQVVHGNAATGSKAPSCAQLRQERDALVAESRSVTAKVETKNVALGETADALRAARSDARKRELTRRQHALKRELSILLDREKEGLDRIGRLEKEISTRCGKEGAR